MQLHLLVIQISQLVCMKLRSSMLAYAACFTHSTEYNNGTCMATKFAVSCNGHQFINLLFMVYSFVWKLISGATSTHAIHAVDHNNA